MKIVLCLFVVAAFIATGESLKCYECDLWNPKCDAFDKSAAGVIEKTCLPQLERCSKSSAKLSNGTSFTARGCVPAIIVPTRAATNVTYESQTSFYCSTDLCNGVSSTGAALTTLMVVIAPLIFKN